MGQEPAVTIPDVAAIRALRLYRFGPSQLSELKWYEVYDSMFTQMNPGLGPSFLLRHMASGFANVRVIASPSTEKAAEDVATVLRTLVGPRLQAFIQVGQFTVGVGPGPPDSAWLVSFISGARCAVDEAKAQVVFLAQGITLSP